MNVDDQCSPSTCTTRLENSVSEFINTTADRQSITCITAEVLLTLLRKKENADKVCSDQYITYMAQVKQSINAPSNEAVDNRGDSNDSEMVIQENKIPDETREELMEWKEPMEQVEVNFDSSRNWRGYSHNLE